MDLVFHLVKRFTVSIFLCQGRDVESEKLFGAGKDDMTY